MRSIRVTFDDGQKLETNINGTDDEIRRNYLGQEFEYDENKPCHVATAVEFLDETDDELESAKALGFETVEHCREHQVWLDAQAEQRRAIQTGYKIGDQIQSIECNWRGRVTAFETIDGVTMLVCHHYTALGEIELDDKRWFDPRDVRKV